MTREMKLAGTMALIFGALLLPEDSLAGDLQGSIAAVVCGTWIGALLATIASTLAKQWLVRVWNLVAPPPSRHTYVVVAGLEFLLATFGLCLFFWLLYALQPIASPLFALFALILVDGCLQRLLVGNYQHKPGSVLILTSVYPLCLIILTVLVNFIIFSIFETGLFGL